MQTINSNTRADGGIQKSRGSLFQQYGILLYLLLRHLQNEQLSITIEPSEGEDAKFILTENASPIIELVQYKKTEATDDTIAPYPASDDWKEGPITLRALKKWVTRKRPDISVEDILNRDSNAFFTAIVFGALPPGLKGFIPEGLQDYMSGASGFGKKFSDIFPVTYTHRTDPLNSQTNKKLLFGDEALRKRIRLVRFASPSMLELQCRHILERFYKVSRVNAPYLVDRLLVEIAKRESYKNETDRQLFKLDIQSILAESRRTQNKWQDSRQFLQRDVREHADVNRGESPRWIDFEHGRFAKFDEFEQAWIDLLRNGFVVICGLPGTGKTVLAQYLAYRFIMDGGDHAAFYLQIKSNLSLQNEIEFLEDRLQTDTLFIVDDQHLAFEEVELLTQTFADYHSIGKARAKLVVTSVQTFGKTGRGKRGRETVLTQAMLTRLIYDETDKTRDCIASIRRNCALETPLSDAELVSLSGGNLGLSLLIARCAQDLGARNPQSLFDSRALKRTIKEWLLLRLNLDQPNLFLSDIVPIFVAGFSSLPIATDFTPLVPLAANAGFLERDEFNENPSGDTYFVSNYALAKIVRYQHRAQELDVLTTYVKKYPEYLALFCERLGETAYGPSILRELFYREQEFLVQTVSDPATSLRLDELSKILRFINLADHGGEDIRFVRALMAADGSINYRFFSRFIRRERIDQINSVAVFFNTIHRIDRFIAKAVAATIGQEQLDFLLGLVAESDCRLDQVGSCIHALSRCSRDFALLFYEKLKEERTGNNGAATSLLAQKIEQTRNDPRELHIWVRFCEEVRFFNRRDCYDYLDKYLPKQKLIDAFANTTQFIQIGSLLLRLQKLNPKLAAEVISQVFEQSPQLIKQLLRDDPKIISLSSDLFVLSKLNRRLAVSIAFDIKERIESLMAAEVHYNDAASVLHLLSTLISPQLGEIAAKLVNREVILSDFQRDIHRVSMVGRSLYNIALVSQELADWIRQRLNYADFITDIHSRFAYSYTHLIRGFLIAADPALDGRQQLLQQFTHDQELIKNLKDMWLTKCNLTEVGFFLSHLLAIPVGITDILDLIGVDNVGSFRTQVLRKFEEENSTLHFTNGLFAIAKIDLDLATEALDIYLNRLRLESESSRTTRPYPRKEKRPALPQNYKSDDVTDIGCLLRIAAAIDPSRAHELAELINIDTFSAYARRETNWGRLAVFIKGLSEASRVPAIALIQTIGTEKIWEEQYFENEVLDNAIHYGLSLGSVSRAKASEFIHFLLEQDKTRNDVYRQLEVQANLELIANWLRLLPMGGSDFVLAQREKLKDFLLSTLDYDRRLQPLLSAAGALTDCGDYGNARAFALCALEQESQMHSVTQLHRWIDLFHRASRLSRALDMPEFVTHLFARFKDWYFFPKIVAPAEHQSLLLAYTFHLLDSRNDFPHLQRGVRERQGEIIKALRREKRAVVQTLSLILAKASFAEINQRATNVQWRHPWELGLLALTFATVFPGERNPFLLPRDLSPDLARAVLNNLTEADKNLEFALTLYLATASTSLEDDLHEAIEQASRRADDEVVGSTRWLLRERASAKIQPGHHYLWSILKRTLLRQTYLAWENDLEEAVNNAAFELQLTRDFDALLA